jgi:hypothetical protein
MHNLDPQLKLPLYPLSVPALVTGVHPQMREARKVLVGDLQQQLDPVLVGNLGAVNLGLEDQTFHIYQQVSLSASDLLAAIVSPVFATGPARLGRLRIDDTPAGL